MRDPNVKMLLERTVACRNWGEEEETEEEVGQRQ